MTDEFLLMVVAEAARLLAKAIRNVPPLPRDVLLFRGVQTNLFELGDTVVCRGFVSATNSGMVATGFAGHSGFVLRLHVPAGTRCLPVFGSMYADELEAILAPGSVLMQKDCHDLVLVVDDAELHIEMCDVHVTRAVHGRTAGVKRKQGEGV